MTSPEGIDEIHELRNVAHYASLLVATHWQGENDTGRKFHDDMHNLMDAIDCLVDREPQADAEAIPSAAAQPPPPEGFDALTDEMVDAALIKHWRDEDWRSNYTSESDADAGWEWMHDIVAAALAARPTAPAAEAAKESNPPVCPAPSTPEGTTASQPSIAALNPPDEFDYCQSLTCSTSIHAASHRLSWLDCGARFERLLCPLAAAPFLEAQADAKANLARASHSLAPEGLAALLIAAADALDPSCSDMRLMALAARLCDAAKALTP